MERAAWLEERRQGLGGSDIAEALGESEYGCKRRLAYDKLGVPEDYPRDGLLVFRRGRELEPIVAARFEELTGWKVVRRGHAVHPLYPWARVTVDREILGARNVTMPDGVVVEAPGVGVLEIKTRGGWQFKRVVRDGAFVSDLVQLQWGMFVRNRAWGALAVFNPESWELVTFNMQYDTKLIEGIVPPLRELWDSIQRGELPARLDPTDRRCARCAMRRTCQGEALAALVGPDDVDAALLEHDETLVELVTDRQEMKAALAEQEALLERIETTLKERLGDRQAVEMDGYRVYYRQQKATSQLDAAMVKAKHPDVFAACQKPRKGARPLRIYPV